MLKAVLTGPHDPVKKPVQLLRAWQNRVVWLADAAAASGV